MAAFVFEPVSNPLVPAGFDVVWGIISAVTLILFLVAFVTLIRKRSLFSLTAAILWFFGIVFVPVVGPLFLLLFTRGKRADEETN